MASFSMNPFDVAPDAPRHAPWAWLTLGVGLVIALVCSFQLARTVQSWHQTERDLARARAAWELAAQRQSRAPTVETAQSTEAKLALRRVLRLSWSSLFATLESAGQRVQGRAAVTSLSPVKLRDGAIEVSITGLAVSPDIMLQYLRALEGQPQVHDIQLASQQPATPGAAEVIRFQAILLWQPAPGTTPAPSPEDRRRGR